MANPLVQFDRKLLRGRQELIGIDEAGRGALAGPVMAAAAVVTREFLKSKGCREFRAFINDSKQLNRQRRRQLFDALKEEEGEHFAFALGSASVEEINQLNILGANTLAMERALQSLPQANTLSLRLDSVDQLSDAAPLIIIDGKPVAALPFKHEAYVKGDGRSFAIAIASIVAKETRDLAMEGLAETFPQYGFDEHMGYGTSQHRAALLEHGPSPQHRPLFLRKLFGDSQQELPLA